MHPVGTGPFVFDDWVPNSTSPPKRNRHYWRPASPTSIRSPTCPSSTATPRANSLKAGTIDIMHTDVPEVILQFQNDDSYNFIDDSQHVVGEPDMNFIMCNLSSTGQTTSRCGRPWPWPSAPRNTRKSSTRASTPRPTNPLPPVRPTTPPPAAIRPTTPRPAAALVKEIEQETGKPVAFTLASTAVGIIRPGRPVSSRAGSRPWACRSR